jgi:hypothetical protein
MAEMRTVLFTKGDTVAALSLFLDGAENYVGFCAGKPERMSYLLAHRKNPPRWCEAFPDANKAIDRYQSSVALSIKNGWQIAFSGQPGIG